jgi:hypothetical protein
VGVEQQDPAYLPQHYYNYGKLLFVALAKHHPLQRWRGL